MREYRKIKYMQDYKTFREWVDYKFKEKQWRITIGVRSLVEVLEEAEYFLSVKEIRQKLKNNGYPLDAATVYRLLEKMGQVHLIHDFDSKWIKCSNPTNTLEHHHLHCSNCGFAEEIFLDYEQSIAKQLKEEKDFLLKDVKLDFIGRCHRCQ